jgi:hypothetical protein
VLSRLVNRNVAPEYALAERRFGGDDLRRDCGQSGQVDGDDAREIVLV